MKRALLIMAAMAAISAPAMADQALATAKNCMACHAVDKKLVGPSYKDVAAKHKGQADALAKVSARIKSGGSGMYGPVPMPAQPNLKDEEVRVLAAWILAGAPDQ